MKNEKLIKELAEEIQAFDWEYPDKMSMSLYLTKFSSLTASEIQDAIILAEAGFPFNGEDKNGVAYSKMPLQKLLNVALDNSYYFQKGLWKRNGQRIEPRDEYVLFLEVLAGKKIIKITPYQSEPYIQDGFLLKDGDFAEFMHELADYSEYEIMEAVE